MTLPSSGVITIADIQGEFGGANPASLNEYYRGGANVPNIAGNTSIPTSGTISLSNFYGTGAATVIALTPSPGSSVNWNGSGTGGFVTAAPPGGATLIISGGTPPYSWNWTAISGFGSWQHNLALSGSGLTAGNIYTQAGNWSAGFFLSGMPTGTYSTNYRLRITDSASNIVNLTFVITGVIT